VERRADADRRAVGGVARKGRGGVHRRAPERRTHHQILRLVADQERLGEGDEIGAGGLGLGPSRARLGGVAGDIAQCRVELGQRKAEGLAHDAPLVVWFRGPV